MSEAKLAARGAGACAALALLFALAAGGCAGRWGTTRWDLEAARQFSAAQLLPGHRYYLSGSDVGPEAILALREDRPLRSRLWHEVPMTADRLAVLADRMRGSRTDGPFAYALLDDRGERIGAWFSYRRPASVQLLDGGAVDVQPPLPLDGDAWRVPGSRPGPQTPAFERR